MILYTINNCNSVILGIQKKLTGENLLDPNRLEDREDPDNLLLSINGNLEINTWSDISTITFAWSGMCLPVLRGQNMVMKSSK